MHTTFIVLASVALGIQTLILFLAFFGPDLPYQVHQRPREEIGSDYFLSQLAVLCDAQIHRENSIEVLTNGSDFYEAELAATAQLSALSISKRTSFIAAKSRSALSKRSGVTTRALSEHMERADLASHFGRRRSYPGVLPFLHLDQMYYDALSSSFLYGCIGQRLPWWPPTSCSPRGL